MIGLQKAVASIIPAFFLSLADALLPSYFLTLMEHVAMLEDALWKDSYGKEPNEASSNSSEELSPVNSHMCEPKSGSFPTELWHDSSAGRNPGPEDPA